MNNTFSVYKSDINTDWFDNGTELVHGVTYAEALVVMCDKLARILSSNPKATVECVNRGHIDHGRDEHGTPVWSFGVTGFHIADESYGDTYLTLEEERTCVDPSDSDPE